MDWSLRTQFIAPVGATVVLVSALVTGISWSSASSISTKNTMLRFANVYQRCSEANYPMTNNVLNQIRQFSGIDIAMIDKLGSIKASTLLEFDQSASRQLMKKPPNQLLDLALPEKVFDAVWYDLQTSHLGSEHYALVLLIDRQNRWQATLQSLWPPAITGAVSVIVLAFVTTLIASRIANRIERLERGVNRIAEGGYDLIDDQGPDDVVASLAKSVNKMSQQLAVAHDRISKSERSRLINLVASGMAHQLRNSMTGAILCLQVFLRTNPKLETEELSMALIQLRLAQESIRRLLASNSDSEMADYSDLSISEIHNTLESYVLKYAEHHQVEFQLEEFEVGSINIIQQGSAVVGALLNLIMNAIEATGSGGSVRCRLQTSFIPTQNREHWIWQIEDDGPGPNPIMSQSMMEPFVTSKPEGVGLGLSMSKRVAEKLGGSLNWHRQDSKTVFEFSIEKR